MLDDLHFPVITGDVLPPRRMTSDEYVRNCRELLRLLGGHTPAHDPRDDRHKLAPFRL